MIRFAVATAMRQEEICTITRDDVDIRNRTVRDRKDPRKKDGNKQRIPMLSMTGYDAWQYCWNSGLLRVASARFSLIITNRQARHFSALCKELKIDDLHFHDLRHEATRRLFEAGLTIEKVALVTGHRDWKMLRRYTNLRPESLPVGLQLFEWFTEDSIRARIRHFVNIKHEFTKVGKIWRLLIPAPQMNRTSPRAWARSRRSGMVASPVPKEMTRS